MQFSQHKYNYINKQNKLQLKRKTNAKRKTVKGKSINTIDEKGEEGVQVKWKSTLRKSGKKRKEIEKK